MKKLPTTIFGLAFPAIFCVSALAQDPAPKNVRDLIGARASSGETQLKQRGYELYHAEKGSDRIWANWWNQKDFTCISVVTMDGKYDSIVTAPTSDCGISGTASHSDDHENWYDDFKGARPSGAETALKEHGFANVRGTKEDDKSYSWWHNSANGRCLKMTVSQGRVEDIRGSGEGCNKPTQYSGDPPEIMVGSNGEGEVIFSENNCVVYYNKAGARKSNGPSCSKDQVTHADKAMKGYRTEQGMNH